MCFFSPTAGNKQEEKAVGKTGEIVRGKKEGRGDPRYGVILRSIWPAVLSGRGHRRSLAMLCDTVLSQYTECILHSGQDTKQAAGLADCRLAAQHAQPLRIKQRSLLLFFDAHPHIYDVLLCMRPRIAAHRGSLSVNECIAKTTKKTAYRKDIRPSDFVHFTFSILDVR